jgi:hypothetical protein
MACAGVVQQHTPHHLRGNSEELRSAFPARIMLIAETQPRLVHERGRLEGVPLVLTPHDELCLTSKLRVHELDERLARLRVARTPRSQELGDSLPSLRRKAASGGGLRRRSRWGTVGWRDRHAHSGCRNPVVYLIGQQKSVIGLTRVLRAMG